MTAQPCVSLFDGAGAARGPVARMVMLSLALHLGLLAFVVSIRLSPRVQESLASYQVSLVTLPEPAPAPEAPPAPAAPAEARPTPAPSVKPAPPAPTKPRRAKDAAVMTPAPAKVNPTPTAPLARPAPPAIPAPRVSARARAPIAAPTLAAPLPGQVPRQKAPADDLGDLFQGVQAPAAPKLREMQAAPTASPVVKARRPADASPLDKDVQAILNKAQVPDVQVPAPARPAAATPSPSRPRPSLVEEVAAQLRAAPQPIPPSPSRSAVAAKPPSVKRPDTALQVPGANKALSQYLAVIQSRISALWTAPPVDFSGQPLQVVVRFRLHRSGSVTAVVVEKASGNGYYDDAGLRAVKAAQPLPPFPADFTELYLDAHFSFTVGEEAG